MPFDRKRPHILLLRRLISEKKMKKFINFLASPWGNRSSETDSDLNRSRKKKPPRKSEEVRQRHVSESALRDEIDKQYRRSLDKQHKQILMCETYSHTLSVLNSFELDDDYFDSDPPKKFYSRSNCQLPIDAHKSTRNAQMNETVTMHGANNDFQWSTDFCGAELLGTNSTNQVRHALSEELGCTKGTNQVHHAQSEVKKTASEKGTLKNNVLIETQRSSHLFKDCIEKSESDGFYSPIPLDKNKEKEFVSKVKIFLEHRDKHQKNNKNKK
ncbi:hypothetical protein BgiMline_001677 [Biomphalaria glabrata]|uniref:Uncharacterized protein LOC106075393 isoform X1 n=2 Tax=Biomphalaria glabrata TaxID=6526 RepID=A0A9U8EL79_BIOGL|nr:uncharacterized protein LOC106075393 isoform X1 [Biomphalaria glabrata]KAI8769530.1 hypothetical protein BgiMline_001553 [Biomphalaria glabrata]